MDLQSSCYGAKGDSVIVSRLVGGTGFFDQPLEFVELVVDRFFIEVGCDVVDGFCGLFCDAEIPFPLFECYAGHLCFVSLALYFSSGHSCCHVEDLLEILDGSVSDLPSLGFDLLSGGFDPSLKISIDRDFNQ